MMNAIFDFLCFLHGDFGCIRNICNSSLTVIVFIVLFLVEYVALENLGKCMVTFIYGKKKLMNNAQKNFLCENIYKCWQFFEFYDVQVFEEFFLSISKGKKVTSLRMGILCVFWK